LLQYGKRLGFEQLEAYTTRYTQWITITTIRDFEMGNIDSHKERFIMSKQMKRRTFLNKGRAAIVGAGAVAKYSILPHTVLGANEKIIAGVIGAGGRGRANMKNFIAQKEIEVGAVCDVYQQNLQKGLELTGGKASSYGDFRKLLERNDIDVILNSTPDHWHALTTILSCEAGKDVYVEKPISHNIHEGRKMVEFARKNKRIVQVGTQQRSAPHFQQAVRLIRDGALGHIGLVKCWNFTNWYPDGIGNPPDTDPPAGMDWDMWVGPAPMTPYNVNKSQRYFWAYSGGMVTNWGTHLIDIVQWAMSVDAPLGASACGGKFHIQDNRETPDVTEVQLEYPTFICTYTHSHLSAHAYERKASHGITFYGTKGTMLLNRGGFHIEPATKTSDGKATALMEPMDMKGSDHSKAHVKNFIDCVKSRELPISDIEIGHRSTSATHVGNIALLSKERVEWDAVKERVTNHENANKFLTRDYRPPWKLPA
jgi:predicted dehydrogenase